VDVGNVVDIRISAKKNFYGEDVYSNTLVINTRTKGVYNPYIDLNAIYSIPPYGIGPTTYLAQNVYDKLPCTVGNSYNIMVGSWDTTYDKVNGVYVFAGNSNAKAYDWEVYDASWEITGPVELMWEEFNADENNELCNLTLGDTIKVLVTSGGSIAVNVSMTAWEDRSFRLWIA